MTSTHVLRMHIQKWTSLFSARSMRKKSRFHSVFPFTSQLSYNHIFGHWDVRGLFAQCSCVPARGHLGKLVGQSFWFWGWVYALVSERRQNVYSRTDRPFKRPVFPLIWPVFCRKTTTSKKSRPHTQTRASFKCMCFCC